VRWEVKVEEWDARVLEEGVRKDEDMRCRLRAVQKWRWGGEVCERAVMAGAKHLFSGNERTAASALAEANRCAVKQAD